MTGKRSGAVPRLIVFDWDGTLIDSIGSIVDCTYAALDELGLAPIARERILALIGSSLSGSIEALAPQASEEQRRQVLETYRRLWFAEYHHRAGLIEGAEATLSRLAERGMLLAVATAKSRRGLAADLERTGVEGMFHASRTADESAPKPSPVMLLQLLDELGVREDLALMVGDSAHDIEMAHNASVRVVAVSSGAQSEGALRRTEPLDCLASVRDLPAWLDDLAEQVE